MPQAPVGAPGPLLGQWLPTDGGRLAWVASLARHEADAWLSGHDRKISAAADLAPRLTTRMLDAIAGARPADVEEIEIDLSFAAVETDPDGALRREFAAVRELAEGRLAALRHLETLSVLWRRVRGDAGDVFEQAGALLEGGAIETHTDERRCALTVADWSGDLSTAWRPGLAAWEALLHRENVALALRAREAALLGIAAAARGAAQLAALIAAPAPTAAAMTLPLAWRYLRRLWHAAA